MKRIFLIILGIVFFNLVGAQGIKSAVDSNNVFAFKLYANLKGNHNLFYSPFSISSALAMTYAGAKGETEKQMSKTLHFNPKHDSLNSHFEKIITTITADTANGIQLSIANSLWAQNKFHFLNTYTDLIKQFYLSQVNNVDFADVKTRDEINGWVEKKTNNKITDLLPKGSINGNTKLVLVNALYFHGEWAAKFKTAFTTKDFFYRSSKDSVSADFMHMTEYNNYYEDSKFNVVEIPYKNNKASMLVFLPVNSSKMRTMQKDFTFKYYTQVINSLKNEKVSLSLPKFKVTMNFDLSDTLKKMGMPLAFIAQADFSGMDGSKDLFISKVLHKAYIAITEDGTEAAAATAVIKTIGMAPPTPMKHFKADHPFMFIIKDNATGSILFMGQINNPAGDN